MPKKIPSTRIALTGKGKVPFKAAVALLDDYMIQSKLGANPLLVVVLTDTSEPTDITFKLAEWCVESEIPFELQCPQVELWMKEVAEAATDIVEYKSDVLKPYFDISVVIMAWDDEDPLGEHIVHKAHNQNCEVLDLTNALIGLEWDDNDPAPEPLTQREVVEPPKKAPAKKSTAAQKLREVVKSDPEPDLADEDDDLVEDDTEADADPVSGSRGQFNEGLTELLAATTLLAAATAKILNAIKGD